MDRRRSVEHSPPSAGFFMTFVLRLNTLWRRIRASNYLWYGMDRAELTRLKRKVASERRAFMIKAAIVGLSTAFLIWKFGMDWLDAKQSSKAARELAGKPPTYSDWDERLHGKVGGILVRNKINCGVFRWKADMIHSGKYLVRCSRDGKDWSEYRVDVNAITIDGPLFPSREND